MSATPANSPAPLTVPLCVDLDGTLIHSDLLWESFVRVLRTRPWRLLMVPWWFVHGRARLKRELARGTALDVATLPYNDALIAFLRAEKARGRPLLLVTASDVDFARPVADHVGLFTETLGSDGVTNLRAEQKAAKLVERFGEKGYDYAGNSPPDLPVWARGRAAVVVNASPALAERAKAAGPVAAEFPGPEGTGATAWRELLRPQQWAKNVLLFAPLLFIPAAERSFFTLAALATAFVAFSLCASAVGIVGDLLNLESDRRSASRRGRPLAAGRALLSEALIVTTLWLGLGVSVAAMVSMEFAAHLGAFVLVALVHARWLRSVRFAGATALGVTHTLRLAAGAAAVGEASFGVELAVLFGLFALLSRWSYFAEP